eukprot:379259-Amphidinium_carterae.1
MGMSVVPRRPHRGRESAKEWRPDWSGSELLPLPDPGMEQAPKVSDTVSLSRGCCQRIQKRRYGKRMVSEAVAGLNWLAGFGATTVTGAANAMQSHALASLADRVKVYGAVPNFRPSEAHATLRGLSGYEPGCPVRAYVKERVALPSEVQNSPFVASFLRGDAGQHYKDLLTKYTVEENANEPEILEPYVDAVLRKSKKKYQDFVAMLVEKQLVIFSDRCKAKAGVFFVAKKNDDLRMVIDARPANRLFTTPPGVNMATAGTFANLYTSNTRVYERWLPSELNPADKASRFFESTELGHEGQDPAWSVQQAPWIQHLRQTGDCHSSDGQARFAPQEVQVLRPKAARGCQYPSAVSCYRTRPNKVPPPASKLPGVCRLHRTTALRCEDTGRPPGPESWFAT